MKASDLMIGDWVGGVFDDRRIIDDYRQIDWIREFEVGLRYHRVWAIGSIESIPLTPEILQKNGYVPFEFGYQHTEEDIKFYVDNEGMSLSLYGKDVDVHNDDINYVHELQHALRLCGLNEMADNFKI